MIFTRSTISELIERPRPNGMTLSSSSIGSSSVSHYNSPTAPFVHKPVGANLQLREISCCNRTVVQTADIGVRCLDSNLSQERLAFITSALGGSRVGKAIATGALLVYRMRSRSAGR